MALREEGVASIPDCIRGRLDPREWDPSSAVAEAVRVIFHDGVAIGRKVVAAGAYACTSGPHVFRWKELRSAVLLAGLLPSVAPELLKLEAERGTT